MAIELYKSNTRLFIDFHKCVKEFKYKEELVIKILLIENIIYFYLDTEYIGSIRVKSKSTVLYPELCSSIRATVEIIN